VEDTWPAEYMPTPGDLGRGGWEQADGAARQVCPGGLQMNLLYLGPVNQDVWIRSVHRVVSTRFNNELAISLKIVALGVGLPGGWVVVLSRAPGASVVTAPTVIRCWTSRAVLEIQKMVEILLFSARVEH